MTKQPSQHDTHIRSYVLRQARMTKAQADALVKLREKWCVEYSDQIPDWNTVFRREAPRILEIGFGMGHATALIANENPVNDYIGVEVHTPGVGALLERIDTLQLSNVRIIHYDAIPVLHHMFDAGALSGVHVFFADPWPKKRHHKRRLIQAEFLRLLAEKTIPGGYLYLATDWQDYADWMLEEIEASGCWKNAYQGFCPKVAWRPSTAFEKKGQAKDHTIREIMVTRTVPAKI